MPSEAKSLAKKYTAILVIHTFILFLTQTYIVLYVIGKVGLAETAFLSSILIFTQGVLDFPLGVLSDSIGQKWVLSLSHICFSAGYIFVVFSNTIVELSVVFAIFGLAFALFSGAFETYIDNNYRATVKEIDQDKKIYGFFISRVQALTQSISVTAFILGGILSITIGRESSFILQGGIGVIFAIIILYVLNDYYDDDNPNLADNIKTGSIKHYLITMKEGIKFLFHSKRTFFFLAGMILYQAIWMIWALLILFVIYFGYTGSDLYAGMFRTSVFLLGIPTFILVGNITKKITDKEWIYKFHLLHAFLFFGGFALILHLIPLTDAFNIQGIVLVALIFTLAGIFDQLTMVLRQRIMIDLVPERIRNSVYSLIPTIVGVLSVPFMSIVGALIGIFSISTGILFLAIFEIAAAFAFYIAFKLPKKESQEKSTP
ncbi:MAG: MFS transporter [Candidatus Hodarchaeales archaeon]